MIYILVYPTVMRMSGGSLDQEKQTMQKPWNQPTSPWYSKVTMTLPIPLNQHRHYQSLPKLRVGGLHSSQNRWFSRATETNWGDYKTIKTWYCWQCSINYPHSRISFLFCTEIMGISWYSHQKSQFVMGTWDHLVYTQLVCMYTLW